MTSIIKVDQIQKTDGSSFDFGGGKVLQVVQVTGTNATTTTGTSWVSVAGTCSITPTETTSKVYISHHAGGLTKNSQSIGMRLKRDGTVVYSSDRHSGYHNDPSYYGPCPHTLIYLDSPNTTSQVDYTFEMVQQTTGSLRHNDYSAVPNTWVTVLMEIAG